MIWQQNGERKVSEREEDFIQARTNLTASPPPSYNPPASPQIELKVQGNKDIESGLREMVDGEMLEGENAYQLDSGEKKDAQKRSCLGALPDTLIIQLKRFQAHPSPQLPLPLSLSQISPPLSLLLSPPPSHSLISLSLVPLPLLPSSPSPSLLSLSIPPLPLHPSCPCPPSSPSAFHRSPLSHPSSPRG